MAFSFGNAGQSAFGAMQPSTSMSGQTQTGPDLQDIQTEALGFLAIAGEAKVRLLSSPWPKDNLPPPTASLMSVATKKGLIAAAGPESVIIATTESIRNAYEGPRTGDGQIRPFQAQLTLSLGIRVSQVAFTADEAYLILSAEIGGGLAVYEVQSLMNGSQVSAFEMSTNSESLGALVPNPTPEKGELLAIVTTDGKLMIADLKERSFISGANGQVLKDGVSCISWSVKGKQVVAGLADGSAFQMTPEGVAKAQIPRPPNVDASHHVSSITWLENDVFMMVHSPSNIDPNQTPTSTFHLVTRRPKSTEYVYQKLGDPAPNFGLNRSPPHHFLLRLIDFPPNLKDLIIVASTASADIGLFTRSTVPLASDKSADQITGVFTMTEMSDDSRRAQLPVSDTMDDTSPIGAVLDLSSRQKVPKPIPSDEMFESETPLPALLVLNNEGILASWWLVYSESVRQGTSYPGLVGTSDGQHITPAAPVSAFNNQPSKPAFSQSSFSSSQSIGTTFGSPGQPATAFGIASASTPTRVGAFGAPSNLNNKPSVWGSPAVNTAALTGATIGAPTFGSPSAPASGGPAFGASTFGTSSFGRLAAPATASTGFGSSIYGNGGDKAFGKGLQIGQEPSSSSLFGEIGGRNPPVLASTFGSPSAPASGGPAFGTSTFGTSSFGRLAAPATASTGFGSSIYGNGGDKAFGKGLQIGQEPSSSSLFGEIGGQTPPVLAAPKPGTPQSSSSLFGKISGQTPPVLAAPKPASPQSSSSLFGKISGQTPPVLAPPEPGSPRSSSSLFGEIGGQTLPVLAPPEPGSPRSSSSSFGEIGGRNPPVLAPPKPGSPRSPSPVRSSIPARLLGRPEVIRSVSAPTTASKLLGIRTAPMSSSTFSQALQYTQKEERRRGDESKQKVIDESQALVDEDDERTQEFLNRDIEGTTRLDEFVAHQDYVGNADKDSVPFPVEAVYRDINSMMDTLGVNSQALQYTQKEERRRGDELKQKVIDESQALVDEDDERTQEFLNRDIEGTTRLDEFVAHQDYVGNADKDSVPFQVEAVYRDINSMIDTLGVNSRTLKSFVKGHTEEYKDPGRERTDLEGTDEWCLGEIGSLASIIEKDLARDLEQGRIKDPFGKLELCSELAKDVTKLRFRKEEISAVLSSTRDPDHVALNRSQPLTAEQAIQQHDLRRDFASFQKLLGDAEEELILLRTKLASLGGSDRRVSGGPTVEAVMRTVMKMTAMAEKRSGDVDVLENQMRRLRFSSAASRDEGSREDSPFGSPAKVNMRHTAMSSTYGRPYTPDGSRNPARALHTSLSSSIRSPSHPTPPRKKLGWFTDEDKSRIKGAMSRKKEVTNRLKSLLEKSGTTIRPMGEA